MPCPLTMHQRPLWKSQSTLEPHGVLMLHRFAEMHRGRFGLVEAVVAERRDPA